MQQIVYTNNVELNQVFGNGEFSSIIYHDMFDYPLTFKDMIRWKTGTGIKPLLKEASVVQSSGYYYLEGQKPLVLKRTMRMRLSKKKIAIANKAARLLSIIPSVKMVGLTGALAMRNTNDDSDIDFMIVTKEGTLWTTRMLAYVLLKAFGMEMRKPGNHNQKDKMCLNIWIDEKDVAWERSSQNIFTAHEIAQIEPLFDRGGVYRNIMEKNKWLKRYWPNAVQKKYFTKKATDNLYSNTFMLPFLLLEPLSRKIQMVYMKNKITRETVTPTKALFHPVDWSSIVVDRLQNRLSIS